MLYNISRPNCASNVRKMILLNVLCTVYCGRGCVSLESEWKRIVAETGQRDNNGHQRKSKRSSRPLVPKMILKLRQLLIKNDTLYYLNFLVTCGVYKTKLDFSFQNGGILFN